MKNRRNFMTWLAGFFGIGAIAETAQGRPEPPKGSNPNKLKGFLVCYLNVGQLPPYKAEAFAAKIREQWKPLEGWEFIIACVRPPQETKIEIFSLEGNVNKIESTRLSNWLCGCGL